MPSCFVAQLRDRVGGIVSLPSSHNRLHAFGGSFAWENKTASFRACNVTIIAVNASQEIQFTAGDGLTAHLRLNFTVSPFCSVVSLRQVSGGCAPADPSTAPFNFTCDADHNVTAAVVHQQPHSALSLPNVSAILTSPMSSCSNLTVTNSTNSHATIRGEQCFANAATSISDSFAPLVVLLDDLRIASSAFTIGLASPAPTIKIFGLDARLLCVNSFPSVGLAFQNGQSKFAVIGENFEPHFNVSIIFSDWPVAIPAYSEFISSSEIVVVGPVGFGSNGRIRFTDRDTGAVLFTDTSSRATFNFMRINEHLCGRDANGTLCSDRGPCDAHLGRCLCHESPTLGFWDGHACDVCALTHNNSVGCTTPCPLDNADNVCFARGTCARGNCTCNPGFAGTSCQIACPGSPPCSDNGICSVLDGGCACFNDAINGYFTDSACSTCVEGWSGERCNKPCPRDPNGDICSNLGKCFDGVCLCPSNYCGSLCEVYDPQNCKDCPFPGLFGPNCDQQCPGGAHQPCYGHGVCSAGRQGSGTCLCTYGYAKADCTTLCPGGASNPCSGNGVCTETAYCICDKNFASTSCAVHCPRGGPDSTTCASHGICNDGHANTGACTCFKGYAGPSCDTECPGGTANPCHGGDLSPRWLLHLPFW